MGPRTSKLTLALKRHRDDANVAWTFFRQWLKAPLTTAAVSPSSQELAAEMLRELPEHPRRVVELGGGTGVFTQALLQRGVAPEHLLVFELNETLHQHLQEKFPRTPIVCADARELIDVVRTQGFAEIGEIDAVISGLGLLSMNADLQREILAPAFQAMAADGRFIQFTYGPTNPVKASVMRDLGLHARRAGFTLRNLPPASVFVLTRSVSKSIKPTQVKR